MSTNAPINTPYLRSQRQFPTESPQALQVELDKTYIDVSLAVNNRTIGLFPKGQIVTTGEQWFLQGANQKQQGQRQVYIFTSYAAIPHNINLSQIYGFVRIWGAFVNTSGVWYPLPYVDPTAANQVGVKVDSTNIIFINGGAAPVVKSGAVVLEWLAQP